MKQINQYRYEIDSENVIRAWNDEIPNENDAPFLYQPVHPDGVAWESREQAEAWVIDLLNILPGPSANSVE